MSFNECYNYLKQNKTRGMRRTSWQSNLILMLDKSNSVVYNYNWIYCFADDDLTATDWEIV